MSHSVFLLVALVLSVSGPKGGGIGATHNYKHTCIVQSQKNVATAMKV